MGQARERQLGVVYRSAAELAAALRNGASMRLLRRSVGEQRQDFTFDAHVDRLVVLFREVVAARTGR